MIRLGAETDGPDLVPALRVGMPSSTLRVVVARIVAGNPPRRGASGRMAPRGAGTSWCQSFSRIVNANSMVSGPGIPMTGDRRSGRPVARRQVAGHALRHDRRFLPPPIIDRIALQLDPAPVASRIKTVLRPR